MNKYEKAFQRGVFNKLYEKSKEDYKAIEELVERATPKNPFIDYYGSCDNYCPKCHGERPMILTNVNHKPLFCHNCGQALDWSE